MLTHPSPVQLKYTAFLTESFHSLKPRILVLVQLYKCATLSSVESELTVALPSVPGVPSSVVIVWCTSFAGGNWEMVEA